MKHEIDHYVCVYGIQIIHVQYIKETSEIQRNLHKYMFNNTYMYMCIKKIQLFT